MLHRMSAQEQKWLIRIVLKDMKLGLGTSRVLQAYHPDARELYDFTNSLQQVRHSPNVCGLSNLIIYLHPLICISVGELRPPERRVTGTISGADPCLAKLLL